MAWMFSPFLVNITQKYNSAEFKRIAASGARARAEELMLQAEILEEEAEVVEGVKVSVVQDSSGVSYSERASKLINTITTPIINLVNSVVHTFKFLAIQTVKLLLQLNYLVLKIGSLFDAGAFVINSALPLAVTAVIAKLTGRTKALGNFVNKALIFVENNLRMRSLAWLTQQALFSTSMYSLQRLFVAITSRPLVIANLIVVAVSTVWTDKINQFIHNVGVKIGLRKPEDDKDLFITIDPSVPAQCVGAAVATCAATALAPALMPNLIFSAVVAAGGAQVAQTGYNIMYAQETLSTESREHNAAPVNIPLA